MRVQTVEAGCRKARFPAADRGRCGPQSLFNDAEGRPRPASSQAWLERHIQRARAGLSDAAEFHLLRSAGYDVVDGHSQLDVIKASNVYSATGH